MGLSAGDALLVVDVQNDFCPGGALAVPEGDAVVPVVNRLAASFRNVILTQDWHPPEHLSFASSHPGRKPGDVVQAPYGEQMLWPDHCVQATHGAELHEALEVPRTCLVLRKGMDPVVDSYSAFFENGGSTPTGLRGYLEERRIGRIFVAGLAADFCVRYTALDARKVGLDVVVVEDAVRSIDVDGSLDAAWREMEQAGVRRAASREVARGGGT
ncbi:MAG: bifunctional nicotinamidase/pyrazinamidase [Deltaproteobacteria bacterium]|nr:bifunctional nicotinamidase/pyrazinamidase [Deltaproteobacteria bacterium]